MEVCIICLNFAAVTCFFQTCIAKHESNGIDIIIALIVNPINPLGKNRLDLVLELKVSCRYLGEPSEATYFDNAALICFTATITYNARHWEQNNERFNG